MDIGADGRGLMYRMWSVCISEPLWLESLGCMCVCVFVFFLMIRRPPRSTLDRSSAASDVYKRQALVEAAQAGLGEDQGQPTEHEDGHQAAPRVVPGDLAEKSLTSETEPVSYTHLPAHETVLDLVCRPLLQKKKNNNTQQTHQHNTIIN